MCQCIFAPGYQVIDLKGELANSKAGQAAIKQAVDTAAKEQAASAAREKAFKVCHVLHLLHARALLAHRGIINGDIHIRTYCIFCAQHYVQARPLFHTTSSTLNPERCQPLLHLSHTRKDAYLLSHKETAIAPAALLQRS